MSEQVLRQENVDAAAPALPTPREQDARALAILARKSRAETYFIDHLKGQREWYGREAGYNKKMTARLSLLLLTFGSMISLIQLLAPHFPVIIPYVTALLGALVVITKGLERIGKYEETWIGYRTASEGMKREFRLYINNAGDYANAEDEEDAYRSFVETVESIVADEEHQFWQNHRTTKEMEKTAADTTHPEATPTQRQSAAGRPQEALGAATKAGNRTTATEAQPPPS